MFRGDSAVFRTLTNNHSWYAVATPAQVIFYVVFLVKISKEETSQDHKNNNVFRLYIPQ